MVRSLLNVLATTGLMVAAFCSANPRVVLSCGFLLVILLLASIFAVRKSPHVSLEMKRSQWYVLLLVAGLFMKMAVALHQVVH